VTFGFLPEVVVEKLDQERTPAGGLRGQTSEAGLQPETGSAKGVGVGLLDFPDCCCVEVYPVGPAEEGGYAFVEQVGNGGRQSREDESDRQALTGSAGRCGQMSDLVPVTRMDLVNGNDQARALFSQQIQQLLSLMPH
jgi:hypothetical protein